MYSKAVHVIMYLNGERTEIVMNLSCVPTTSHEELIRRASNMLKVAAETATYIVS